MLDDCRTTINDINSPCASFCFSMCCQHNSVTILYITSIRFPDSSCIAYSTVSLWTWAATRGCCNSTSPHGMIFAMGRRRCLEVVCVESFAGCRTSPYSLNRYHRTPSFFHLSLLLVRTIKRKFSETERRIEN